MAYQPVQLPAHMGVETAMQGLGDSLRNLGAVRRDNRNFAAEQERMAQMDARQKQGDFQQARVMAEKAFAEKNYALAEDIMRPFVQGMQQQDPAAEAMSLKAQMGIPDTAPSQGPTPAGQALMAKMGMGAGLASQNPMMGTLNGGVDSESMAPEAPSMPQLDQMMGASHGNGGMNEFERIRAANVAEGDARKQNFQKAWGGDPEQRRRLTGTDYMGRPFTIDPEGARQSQRAQQDQERERMAAMAEEMFPGDYGKQTAMLIKLTGDEKFAATTVTHSMETAAAAKARAEAEAAKAEAARIEWDRQNKITSGQQDHRNSVSAAAARAARNEKPLGDTERKAGATAGQLETLMGTLEKIRPPQGPALETMMKDIAYEAALSPKEKAGLMATGLYTPLGKKLDDDGRAYINQMREITRVLLRKQSGAAISIGEIQETLQAYGRQPGESDADYAQKQANLRLAIQAIRNETRAGDSDVKATVGAKGEASTKGNVNDDLDYVLGRKKK